MKATGFSTGDALAGDALTRGSGSCGLSGPHDRAGALGPPDGTGGTTVPRPPDTHPHATASSPTGTTAGHTNPGSDQPANTYDPAGNHHDSAGEHDGTTVMTSDTHAPTTTPNPAGATTSHTATGSDRAVVTRGPADDHGGTIRLDEAERLARVAIMRMAEAGDAVMNRLIARYGPVAAMEQARRGVLDSCFARDERDRAQACGRHLDLDRLAAAWAARYTDPAGDLAHGEQRGARLVLPGDVEWPTQLDGLKDSRPFGLWVDGRANLRFSCLRSVSVVGARAATAYGTTVAAELATSLGERGWTVISGGAYGIDGAAHRGALASGTPTVVVLACGTDVCYPSAHEDLFRAVREKGVVVSEWPPGAHPTRPRFLIRNRVIAALSRGTVVVQAAARSGALNTATHALNLNRHLMAVPGPITTEVSTGCHVLIRQGKAVCVTSAEEIIELVGAIGDDLAPEQRGPVRPRDGLNDETRRVLEAIPARGATGPAAIAVAAGVDIGTALACLGALAAAGFVENVDRGWRLRPAARR